MPESAPLAARIAPCNAAAVSSRSMVVTVDRDAGMVTVDVVVLIVTSRLRTELTSSAKADPSAVDNSPVGAGWSPLPAVTAMSCDTPFTAVVM